MAAPIREFGFPDHIEKPFYLFETDAELKADPDYKAAKSGNRTAAVNLVARLALPLFKQFSPSLKDEWKDAIFVAPHAEEATGDNAIPQVLATLLSLLGGQDDVEIVQSSRVFHTGADAMQRLISRASFEGEVVPGGKYVLVDDVTTLGGTLADLGDYIQRNGGIVKAVAVLVNANRSGRLRPDGNLTKKLLARGYENGIIEIFGIRIGALTAEEAQYLVGFRNVDEIRGRATKAREERDLRLRAKGIFGERD